MLPQDLKDYRADEDDAFVLLSPGDAFVAFVVILAVGWIVGRFA